MDAISWLHSQDRQMTKYLETVHLTEGDLRLIQGGLNAAQFAISKYICSKRPSSAHAIANEDTNNEMLLYDAIQESETIFKIYKK
jgi:hypothetical protein